MKARSEIRKRRNKSWIQFKTFWGNGQNGVKKMVMMMWKLMIMMMNV